MAIGIITAGGGHDWEAAVVSYISAVQVMRVVRRCPDVTDVLATATTGKAQACLLAADLPRLDIALIDQLAAYGVLVAVVYRAGDERLAARLDRVGVACTIPDDAEPAEIVGILQRQVATGLQDARGEKTALTVADPQWSLGSNTVSRQHEAVGSVVSNEREGTHDVGTPGDAPALTSSPLAVGLPDDGDLDDPTTQPDDVSAAAAGGPHDPGAVWAVWGARGGPGKTTIAVNVAAHLAAEGQRVMLIDADVYGGALASALGVLDESAGLAGACRLASQGDLSTSGLTSLCLSIAPRLSLLTGITRADRWPEVRPTAFEVVLDRAAELADVVIVDCASLLEIDEELSFDTLAPRRNGATLTALARADQVLAVGRADPLGATRLIRALADFKEFSSRNPQVIFNKLRASSSSKAELVEAVERFARLTPTVLIPDDVRACDKAWRDGVPAVQIAPRSDFAAAIRKIAARLSLRERVAGASIR